MYPCFLKSSIQYFAEFYARQQGVTRFEAYVLKGNTAMLHVFSRSGLPMEQMVSGGEVCVILRLKKE